MEWAFHLPLRKIKKYLSRLRYFVQLSYFGKNYHGWQIQPNATSVQESLNGTLSTICNAEVYVVGAGRTDTGVHAREMWAHFDVENPLPENILNRVNRFLSPDIAVQQFVQVEDDAHARFDATARSYQYHIVRHKNPFLKDLAWFCPYELDVDKMNAAAQLLFDHTDFTSFSRSKTQTKTNNCKILHAHWEEAGEELVFHISADRFLRNMVRAVVGTLVNIGRGKQPIESLNDIVAAKDRSLAGDSAPAHGLFLTRVEYPKHILNGR